MGYRRKPRRFTLKIYNLIDKLKFSLKIKPKSDLIIVSGADSSHFKSLVQFIRSALYYEYLSRLVIYDLGLTKEESDFIKGNFPKVYLRVFDYSKYPSYFNIKVDAGKFAWRPVIISDVLHEYKCPTIWLDAGCVITQPLYRIRKIVLDKGFYSPVCSSKVKDWIHPTTIHSLNISNELLEKNHFAGGVVAFDPAKPNIRCFFKKWKQCALTKDIVAPDGWNRKQHRAQSVFTVLALQLNIEDGNNFRLLGVKIHQDVS